VISPANNVADAERSAFAHISYFSIAHYLSEALFIIRGLLLARIFGPAIFGIWTEMKLVLLFLQYAHLGTHEAMIREVPYAVGRGDRARADNIKRTVIAFNLSSSAVTAIGIFTILLVSEKVWNADIQGSWSILVCIFFISQVYWFIHLKLQAEKRFGRISKIMLGFALCSTVLGTLCAYYFSIEGFLLVLGLSYFVMLVYAGEGHSLIPLPNWNTPLLRELIKTGFPIMASGALLILLWNVDKLAIWLLMSKEDLGIYAVQSYIANTIMLVPSAVSIVLYPRVMETYGKTGIPSDLERYLTQPTLIMSYLACPLLGILFLALHLPIKWLLPKYVLAIVPGQILILAIFFMVIARMPANMLISLNRQKLLLALTGISVLVGAVADYIFIRIGEGIIGVAVGTSLGFIVYSSLTMVSSLHAVKMSIKRSVSFLVLVALPYVVVLSLAGIMFKLLSVTDAGWVSDFVYTSISCLLITALMGVLIYAVNTKFHFFQRSVAEVQDVQVFLRAEL